MNVDPTGLNPLPIIFAALGPGLVAGKLITMGVDAVFDTNYSEEYDQGLSNLWDLVIPIGSGGQATPRQQMLEGLGMNDPAATMMSSSTLRHARDTGLDLGMAISIYGGIRNADGVVDDIVDASRVRPVNGRMPINSAKYAGRTIPLADLPVKLRAKYPHSVHFSGAGYPDFTRYSIRNVRIKLGKSRAVDFRRADKAAGFTRANPRPQGYTWHHHQDSGFMQLVPTDLHSWIKHTGGIANQ